ncbi:hypothetical protein GUJ93_ZPchr0006g45372 [Zizania palustris]|uniref:Uncharacterized protein n=1 Tax=Zizania palustris TaxID=103762 RepID=A0A8J5VGV7_ZIZPA|nr:hypothetical protein GUJ93_ZPchr0006g45372 [Zizania palustris]
MHGLDTAFARLATGAATSDCSPGHRLDSLVRPSPPLNRCLRLPGRHLLAFPSPPLSDELPQLALAWLRGDIAAGARVSLLLIGGGGGEAMELGLGRYWGVGGRRCGQCGGSPAAVHCRTCGGGGGGEYLCAGCDVGHARAGHERVWVCEVCELAPAAVTCKADAAALCTACDADIHDANPLARRHERVHVQPIGSASALVAAADALLFGGGNGDRESDAAVGLGAKEGKLDFLFADVMDPYFGGSELPRFPQADSVVPNNKGSIGAAVELGFGVAPVIAKPSYSSYMAASLGTNSGSSSDVGLVPDAICGGGGGGGIIELDFAQSKAAYVPYASTPSHSVSSVDVGVTPERGDVAAAGRMYAAVPASAAEGREARLMRYREKRKNRRFDKTIRYASRKAYAETRPRIKGRFAKRTGDHDGESYAETGADASPPPPPQQQHHHQFMLDFAGYGVVPTF